MSGTKAGGRRAAAINRKLYGKNFYRDIGRRGGQAGHSGGFAANPEFAKIAGAMGGRKSKRGIDKRIAKIFEEHGDKIKRDYHDGTSYKALGDRYEISATTVRAWLIKEGQA